MAQQQLFKIKYAESLHDDVKEGLNLELYSKDTFPYIYDDQHLGLMPMPKPNGLLESIMEEPDNDCKNAIKLYEAYPNLTNFMASYYPFWITLSHTDLFPYVQHRWPNVKNHDFNDNRYILSHWFMDDGLMGNSLSNLWWSVKQTIDESKTGEDKYELTRVLFYTTDEIRLKRLTSKNILSNKETLNSFLRFVRDNKGLFDTYKNGKIVYVMKYLTKLYSVKAVSTMSSDNFYAELYKLKSKLSVLTGRDEVQGHEVNLNIDSEALTQDIENWENAISNMKMYDNDGKVMLFKPLVLLVIINLIDQSLITSNIIEYDYFFKFLYDICYKTYCKDQDVLSSNEAFCYMNDESFFYMPKSFSSIIHDESLIKSAHVYAYLDDALWGLLQVNSARNKIKDYIIKNLFCL
jgi:hypothetical protein